MPTANTNQLDLFPEGKTNHAILIEFDGGTPCNVPSKGYGIGYGSYCVDHGAIVRCDFKLPMSANTAEIMTLLEAIKSLRVEKSSASLNIIGDSQVALSKVKMALCGKTKISAESTELYRRAVLELSKVVQGWKHVEVEYRPRKHSVRVFGH